MALVHVGVKGRSLGQIRFAHNAYAHNINIITLVTHFCVLTPTQCDVMQEIMVLTVDLLMLIALCCFFPKRILKFLLKVLFYHVK